MTFAEFIEILDIQQSETVLLKYLQIGNQTSIVKILRILRALKLRY